MVGVRGESARDECVVFTSKRVYQVCVLSTDLESEFFRSVTSSLEFWDTHTHWVERVL